MYLCLWFKGGYLDFLHLTELKKKYIYITEIYIKKKYKSSIVKNHKITKNIFVRWYFLKRLRSLFSYF